MERYYYNNTVSTMILAKACLKFDVKHYVLSSSTTIYGNKIDVAPELLSYLTEISYS